jgi:hypothetical protein
MEYQLTGNILNYNYEYRGFPENKDIHYSLHLSDSALKELLAKFHSFDFSKNHNKHFQANNAGFSTEIGMSLMASDAINSWNIAIKASNIEQIDDEMYNRLNNFYFYLQISVPMI